MILTNKILDDNFAQFMKIYEKEHIYLIASRLSRIHSLLLEPLTILMQESDAIFRKHGTLDKENGKYTVSENYEHIEEFKKERDELLGKEIKIEMITLPITFLNEFKFFPAEITALRNLGILD